LLPILAYQNKQWNDYHDSLNEAKLTTNEAQEKLLKPKTQKFDRKSLIMWSIHDGFLFTVGVCLGVYGIYDCISKIIKGQ